MFPVTRMDLDRLDGPGWTWADQGGPGWTRADSGGPKWTRADPDRPRLTQTDPDGPGQTSYGSLKKLQIGSLWASSSYG